MLDEVGLWLDETSVWPMWAFRFTSFAAGELVVTPVIGRRLPFTDVRVEDPLVEELLLDMIHVGQYPRELQAQLFAVAREDHERLMAFLKRPRKPK